MHIKLRNAVCNKLDNASLLTSLNKNTIVNIAFHNGIESLNQGYNLIPKRTPNGLLNEVDISVSNYLIECIKKYANALGYSQRALKETFIEQECDRLIKNLKKYDEESEYTSIKIKIPSKIKNEIKSKADKICISDNQYYQYLLLQGFLYHKHNYLPLTLEKDRNLIQEIKQLRISPLKAYCLINFMAINYFNSKELELKKFLSDYIEDEETKKKLKARKKREEKKNSKK